MGLKRGASDPFQAWTYQAKKTAEMKVVVEADIRRRYCSYLEWEEGGIESKKVRLHAREVEKEKQR